MLNAVRVLSFILLAAAFVGLGCMFSTTPTNEWGSIPTAGGVSVITASLAALVALAATESFNARRQRETESALRSRREDVYEKLLGHMTGIFRGGNPNKSEVEIRAAVAVWASADVIDKLAAWNAVTYRIMRDHNGNVPPEDRVWLQEALGDIAVAVRKDLAPHLADSVSVSSERIAKMVFNDYSQ